jgi:uncharacterized membrane protein YbhN (UPF0104 family)
MQSYRAMAWRAAKIVLTAVVLAGVSWQFAKILRRDELWQEPFRPNFLGLICAALLYVVAFSFWGGFWFQLVRGFGERLPLLAGMQAYFVSQLGKYAPGKALVIVLRVALARQFGVRASVAAITSLYETLTMMAAGALIGAILLPLLKSDQSDLGWKALILLAVAGVPILPGVFNRIAAQAVKPFLAADAAPLPKLRSATLLSGLAQGTCGWFALGGSLLAVVSALEPELVPVSLRSLLVFTAYVAVSYVVGFIALIAPGGLGVREMILQTLLTTEFAAALGDRAGAVAVVVVLLLRIVWTVTELTLAATSFLVYSAYRLMKAPA